MPSRRPLSKLSVNARVLERLIADGHVETVRIGRRPLVPHDALEAYITKLRRTS